MDILVTHKYLTMVLTRHTSDLKQQIERILDWGPSKHWRLRDFTDLAHRVRAHTGERIDARDLQTFWQSSARPSPILLDVLARFADFDDWTDFCARNSYGVVKADDEMAMLHAPMWEIPMRWVIVICWLSVLASVIVGVLLLWKR